MKYYAHSGRNAAGQPDLALFQPLAEHLLGVAEGARRRAAAVGLPGLAEVAHLAGLLHDLGKYRPEFQEYIRGAGLRAKGDPLTYHKQAGAAKALEARHNTAAIAIAGHHGGMPNAGLMGQVVKDGKPVADQVWKAAVADCAALAGPVPAVVTYAPGGFAADLFTRLLFSCLVDADWSDTGGHGHRVAGLADEPKPRDLDPSDRLARVEAYIAGLAGRPLEPHVKAARAAVLAACLAAADGAPGLYSLTVPTGGGKTLAALAFALKHAARYGLRRVIYVAPYTTILEQNADVLRAALGLGRDDPDLFEHHGLAEPPDDGRPEETGLMSAARRAENWDAPLVVTTNVQFFESLFGNAPGRCRKLHNVARSVVVLDECQTLPPGLVAPTCGMLRQLAGELACTVVLCTATQPAFDHDALRDDERLRATEIVPKSLDLFGSLHRVSVAWPKPGDPPLEWSAVAERMRSQASPPAALCVVNTKKAARAVHDELARLGTPGLFHLSTGMCPQHRREKLAQIRASLQHGAPCYVVSTQLIEAGVDVDFPFLMREMAPLESVIQAAGRCNREGKIPNAGGRVVVFRSAEGKMPPDLWYKAGRGKIEQIIAAKGDGPQIDDPDAIRDYFGRLYYTGNLDERNVRDLRKTFKFQTCAEQYRLIDDAGQPVVVATWEPHRAEIAELLSDLAGRPRKAAYRKQVPFQVNLLPSQAAKVGHLLHEGPGGVLVWDGKYDDHAGIVEEMADSFII